MTDKEKENIIRERQKNAFYAVNRLRNEEKAQLCMLVCDFCTYYEKSITKSKEIPNAYKGGMLDDVHLLRDIMQDLLYFEA